MVPGEIGARLSDALRAAVSAGELPATVAGLTAAGTWRPAPVQAGGGPGTYASSLPFTLARLTHRTSEELAGRLASQLSSLPWISSARVTGGGYLTVTATVGHLAGLAARIVAAGPDSARSDALAGLALTVQRAPDLTAARGWGEAWQVQCEALSGQLARTAGAKVNFFPSQQCVQPASSVSAAMPPVAAAMAYYGPDAVRYALARTATGDARAIERQLSVPLDLSNPFVAVTYAHADAVSTLRWAADLDLTADARSESGPDPATRSAELALLDLLSWLPERVAAAARRRRPAELAAYLECLAGSWLDCRERCPALPFHGAAAARDPAIVAARLRLARATGTALRVGLRLLGVTAPDRA
jgi:arginyl-tRNA synthetase